jgi:LacI family transcriptional regulator
VKTSVTIHDVAIAAGVSVSTVSRVLNNKSDVSPETARRIRLVIDDLGYASSLAARSLRSHKTNVIGIIMPNMDHAYSLQVLKGVSLAVMEAGYDLLAYTSGNRTLRTRAAWEQQQVALLNSSITDGVIVVTPFAHALRTNGPLVAIDPHNQGADFPAVISTNRAGVIAAMEYLLGLGHRRIGFIGGRPDLQSSQRRLQGYLDSLAQAQIAVDPALIQMGDYNRATGYTCAQQLLALAVRPTAIFAANDNMALGVMAAAKEAGVAVPQDLSVIGFDNIPETAAADPALTTVDQALETMGRLAVAILFQGIAGEQLVELLHKVQTTLVVRKSCQIAPLGGG